MYVVLTEDTRLDEIMHNPTLLYFTATWCEPCQGFKPTLQKLGKQGTIVEVDVDVHETIANKYKVQSVPYLVHVKNSSVVWSHVGVLSSHDIVKHVFRTLPRHHPPEHHPPEHHPPEPQG